MMSSIIFIDSAITVQDKKRKENGLISF
jgi:hypothetical protein